MHMDQAGAASEGLVLVRCAGNATGFKGVQAHGNGFRGFYRHGPKGRKALRYTQVVAPPTKPRSRSRGSSAGRLPALAASAHRRLRHRWHGTRPLGLSLLQQRKRAFLVFHLSRERRSTTAHSPMLLHVAPMAETWADSAAFGGPVPETSRPQAVTQTSER